MNPIVVDGKGIAHTIIENLKQKPTPKGFLAIFVSSTDMIAQSFVKQKESVARELGIEVRKYEVRDIDTNDVLRARVRKIAMAKRCIGVVLQLPLPIGCSISYVANTIPPQKDIDCLGARNLGGFFQEKNSIVPPVVRVIQHIFQTHQKDIQTISSVAVIGQGVLVGRPLSTWFMGKVPCVKVLDKGFNRKEIQNSDVVILGTGAGALIQGKDTAPGAWVIDFGYSKTTDGKLVGDFDVTKDSIDHIRLYTPTPGGTGPILVASLFENIFSAHA